MKILLTGGTGVIGEGTIPALLRAGHSVRLLSRGAEESVREWPNGVEAFPADVADAASLRGAAEGCEAVIHITGIVEEKPPEITFEKINVEGTRAVLQEAEQSGVKRFLYLSSLGADRGTSEYHRSKLAAEEAVQGFSGEWVILRPGNVYGPGDDVISLLLKMVRVLPIVPVIGFGDQKFQPVWYEDLGAVIAEAVSKEGLSGSILEIGGNEITTMNEVIARFARITGREVARVPIPTFVANIGTQIAGVLGVEFPVNEAKLTMLTEENVIGPQGMNALTEVFRFTPTDLETGLTALADRLPEQAPTDGVGQLEHKRYWADIAGSQMPPRQMVEYFREHCGEVMPIEFGNEPGSNSTVEEGAVLTASLPARGNIQMKVVEATPDRITFATLEGHPLAGVVRFSAKPHDRFTRFEVEVFARAANIADWITMNTVGAMAQRANWETVVQRMVDASGGTAPLGVLTNTFSLVDGESKEVESWVRDLIVGAKRDEHAATINKE